ncbi:MAG: ATP-dependent Clp protease proteolytic subunit [Planctomycetota bacterium]
MKIVLLVVGIVLLGVGLLALQPIADLAQQLNKSIEVAGGAEYVAEPLIDQLVDRLNESGYDHQPIDPDDPMLKARIVLINAGINERVAARVTERLLYLDRLDPTKPIDLRVHTSGGWVDSAFAIVDTMRSIEAPVNVTAVGGCYSAGTVVLAAATGTRSAMPNTVLSVHVNDYWRGDDDYDADVQELARFRRVYQQFTRVPKEWFDEPGDQQYYFDAEQALRMELIDEIAEPQWQVPQRKALAPAA